MYRHHQEMIHLLKKVLLYHSIAFDQIIRTSRFDFSSLHLCDLLLDYIDAGQALHGTVHGTLLVRNLEMQAAVNHQTACSQARVFIRPVLDEPKVLIRVQLVVTLAVQVSVVARIAVSSNVHIVVVDMCEHGAFAAGVDGTMRWVRCASAARPGEEQGALPVSPGPDLALIQRKVSELEEIRVELLY